MTSISPPIDDPRERSLWLREAIQPWRGGGGAEWSLRAPFRPARGHGETYAWLCRRMAFGFSWPVALCLAQASPTGTLTPRGEMRALDFLTIYGLSAWLAAWTGAFDPRAQAEPLGSAAAATGVVPRSRPT